MSQQIPNSHRGFGPVSNVPVPVSNNDDVDLDLDLNVQGLVTERNLVSEVDAVNDNVLHDSPVRSSSHRATLTLPASPAQHEFGATAYVDDLGPTSARHGSVEQLRSPAAPRALQWLPEGVHLQDLL